MNITCRILGESDPTWPKTLVTSVIIKNPIHAYKLWDDGDHDIRDKLEALMNLEFLDRQIEELKTPLSEDPDPLATANSGDILFHAYKEPDFETDDGLEFESWQLADSVNDWISVRHRSRDWVLFPTADGFLQTRNNRTSKCIGTWLKSIGVPFEYSIQPD